MVRRDDDEGPLFETRKAKGRIIYRGFIFTILAGIFLIIFYRLHYLPESGRCVWIGMFISELCFSFFWIITQSVRWNVVHRFPFKHRLLHRYQDDSLPNVDVFICTADPKLEPPSLVINTVLSAMAYNYPPDKFTVYLSDDGGSDLTFYAMVEASKFSKVWVPFCKRFQIEPRSPKAYFSQTKLPDGGTPFSDQWLSVKKLYEEMMVRIDEVSEKGIVPEGLRDQHKGFLEWNPEMSKQNHPSIVQILIDLDEGGVNHEVPRLVYIAREKSPDYHHNFKAGSMNALIRVSSIISNAPIILNVDCDMYSNDSDAILEALCFFMDEEQGHTVAFVQHPQSYSNITKNDIYSNAGNPVHKIELAGMGGYGSALYCGTGCFHRRLSLCGSQYVRTELKNGEKTQKSNHELEEAAKVVANCSYENGSQWGKQMGLVYGCVVEDIITGLSIQCRGWKSIYYYPEKRESFVGLAPTTLDQCLVQQKRWCEGLSQIFFSKYCPFIYGHGKIKIGAQMGYCLYLLWAPFSLPCLYYTTIPSISLLRGISLFPQPTSLWFLPFAYVYLARNICSIYEALTCGDTIKGWINSQRIWLIRRTTPYTFALLDNIGRALGFSETSFAITTKVMEEDVKKRYEEEILEFGSDSIMFTMASTLALLNLLCLVGGIVMRIFGLAGELLVGQTVICLIVVGMNVPVYEALFLRSDNGRIPTSVMINSVLVASALCILLPVY